MKKEEAAEIPHTANQRVAYIIPRPFVSPVGLRGRFEGEKGVIASLATQLALDFARPILAVRNKHHAEEIEKEERFSG